MAIGNHNVASLQKALVVDFLKPQQYVDVGHSQLAYWKTGTGPNLVFVHGWPVHSATFRNLLPAMAKHFTCHLLDLPGAGMTKTTGDTPYGLVHHSETLLRAIRFLGLKRYGLLSHDSGGVIARYVAANDDDAVFGSVIGDTEIPNYRSPLLRLLLALGKIPGGMTILATGLRSRFIRHSNIGFGSCFSNPDLIDDFFEVFGRPLIESKAIRKGQAQLLKNISVEELDRLEFVHARIKSPTQLLWGKQDAFFPVSEAEKMKGQFAGRVAFHVFDPGKLFIHEEFPDRFTEFAIHFFKECLTEISDFKKLKSVQAS